MDNTAKSLESRRKTVVEAEYLYGLIGMSGFIAGLYILFTVHWMIGVTVIAFDFWLLFSLLSRLTKDKEAAFQESCDLHHVAYKPNYSDPQRDYFLGISEDRAELLIQFRVGQGAIQERFVTLPEILGMELLVGDRIVYRTGPTTSSLNRSPYDTVFSGVGSIAGILSGGQYGHGKIGRVALKLLTNDLDDPLIEIPFLTGTSKTSSPDTQARLSLAEKWTNLIGLMQSHSLESGTTSPAKEMESLPNIMECPAMEKTQSKYAPLESRLLAESQTTKELTLSFAEIEKSINAALPQSARKYRQWWSNQTDVKTRPQSRAWLSAGFHVDTVHLGSTDAWVRFKRS